MTMSMMFTVHAYVCMLSKQARLASVLALKWHHWSFNNVLSQTQSLSLEMNQYFVVIAYSNNVYFFAISGDPLGGPPQKIFQARCCSPYFQAPPLPYL